MTSPAPAYTPHNHSSFIEDWSSMNHDMEAPPKKDATTAYSPISNHPDILSPGLESVSAWNGDQGKEVVQQQHQVHQQHQNPQQPENGQYPYQDVDKYPVNPEKQKRTTICGIPKVSFCILILLVLGIIGLAVGLGVGLGTRQ
jgi:hypothetical protein